MKAADWGKIASVGDIIEFPAHNQARLIDISGGRLVLSQGPPGKFRVIEVSDQGLKIEPVIE